MSQVILFDLDGTLTESGEGIINCVAYALEKLGKKEEHPEKLQCFVGPPLKEQFMKYAGLSEEEAEQAVVWRMVARSVYAPQCDRRDIWFQYLYKLLQFHAGIGRKAGA